VSPFRIVPHYFRTTTRILFHPSRFFAALSPEGSLTLPLLYALITHWLASMLAFLWKAPVQQMARNFLREGKMLWQGFSSDLAAIDSPGRHAEPPIPPEALQRLKELILPWLWGSSSVLLNPFFTLASLVLSAFLIYLAARVLIDSEKPIRYRATLRLICFSSAPVLWSVIPIAGSIIAPLAILTTTTIALMETHRTSLGRALLSALFPKISLVLLMATGLVAAGWLAFRALSALLGVG
jgi:hypothetical protein